MSNKQKIKFKILDPRLGTDFPLPAYATPGSAAVDVRACIDEPIILNFGQTHLVPLGFAMHIEDPGLAALLIPRSGLGHRQGIICSHGLGLMDSDYVGQIFMPCWNRSGEAFEMNPGDRIGQMFFIPIVQVKFDLVEEFESTVRSAGGFGHTGRI